MDKEEKVSNKELKEKIIFQTFLLIIINLLKNIIIKDG